MTETDAKKLRETKWLQEHTLTPDQVKRLIEDKLKRAMVMHQVEKRQKQLILGDA